MRNHYPLGKYGLSVALAALFVVSWALQALFQVAFQGEDWSAFFAATFENWQSEFLQLLTFVVLTSFLIHAGSHESKYDQQKFEEETHASLARLGERLDRVIEKFDRLDRLWGKGPQQDNPPKERR
jgi:hypothetical protein